MALRNVFSDADRVQVAAAIPKFQTDNDLETKVLMAARQVLMQPVLDLIQKNEDDRTQDEATLLPGAGRRARVAPVPEADGAEDNDAPSDTGDDESDVGLDDHKLALTCNHEWHSEALGTLALILGIQTHGRVKVETKICNVAGFTDLLIVLARVIHESPAMFDSFVTTLLEGRRNQLALLYESKKMFHRAECCEQTIYSRGNGDALVMTITNEASRLDFNPTILGARPYTPTILSAGIDKETTVALRHEEEDGSDDEDVERIVRTGDTKWTSSQGVDDLINIARLNKKLTPGTITGTCVTRMPDASLWAADAYNRDAYQIVIDAMEDGRIFVGVDVDSATFPHWYIGTPDERGAIHNSHGSDRLIGALPLADFETASSMQFYITFWLLGGEEVDTILLWIPNAASQQLFGYNADKEIRIPRVTQSVTLHDLAIAFVLPGNLNLPLAKKKNMQRPDTYSAFIAEIGAGHGHTMPELIQNMLWCNEEVPLFPNEVQRYREQHARTTANIVKDHSDLGASSEAKAAAGKRRVQGVAEDAAAAGDTITAKTWSIVNPKADGLLYLPLVTEQTKVAMRIAKEAIMHSTEALEHSLMQNVLMQLANVANRCYHVAMRPRTVQTYENANDEIAQLTARITELKNEMEEQDEKVAEAQQAQVDRAEEVEDQQQVVQELQDQIEEAQEDAAAGQPDAMEDLGGEVDALDEQIKAAEEAEEQGDVDAADRREQLVKERDELNAAAAAPVVSDTVAAIASGEHITELNEKLEKAQKRLDVLIEESEKACGKCQRLHTAANNRHAAAKAAIDKLDVSLAAAITRRTNAETRLKGIAKADKKERANKKEMLEKVQNEVRALRRSRTNANDVIKTASRSVVNSRKQLDEANNHKRSLEQRRACGDLEGADLEDMVVESDNEEEEEPRATKRSRRGRA